jgi:16S rRNA (cytidine1402-2'-O)-methyltransferase
VTGTLYVVATPIGNLEDISVRALRILREVAVIAAEDTRRTHHLLARYAIATPTTSLHEHNETRKTFTLVERLRAGDDVALVSDAGTPTVSDPGQLLVRAALDAGLRVVPVPGPSAILAAFVGAGLTSSQSFKFMGFPPTRSKDRKNWFNDLSRANCPVIFYEAPHRLRRTLTDIRDLLSDPQVIVARELTKVHEEFARGTVSAMLERFVDPIGEFTIVIDIGLLTERWHLAGMARASSDQVTSDSQPSAQQLAEEFLQMTKNEAISRRAAIRALATRHRMPSRIVYRAIEEAGRGSVE